MLPPGQSTWPCHYELGNDELLVVTVGEPTLRDPSGRRRLRPGDVVLFPSGPDGAHALTNESDDEVRLLLVSNFGLPRGAVQVDADKLMIRWDSGPTDSLWFRREDARDYWDRVERPADPDV